MAQMTDNGCGCGERNSIRILFVIDHLISEKAGTEQHLLWLLDKLPATCFEKHFAVISGVERTDLTTWPVPGVLLAEQNGKRSSWWQRVKALRKYIQEHQIDIVHSFCPMSELVAVFASNRGRLASIIGVRRNTGYALTRKGVLQSRLIGRYVAGYVTNSEAAKEAAVFRERLPAHCFTVIPNPVLTSRIAAARDTSLARRELAADDELLVVMVATVRPIKDYPTFLRAARLVVDQCDKVRFIAVGEQGDVFPELQAMTHSLGLTDRIRWYGGVDNAFTILQYADIGVLTSQSESFSNAVLEYAAAGLPSVVTDVGGLREIVLDGETGYVVAPRSPQALADKVMTLVNDTTKRHEFGDNGRAHVLRHFSEDWVLSRYANCYKDIAHARGAGGRKDV